MRIIAAVALLLGSCSLVPQRTLTACADPNNLPFSNKAGQGFENKLAQLIASDLHAKLDYIWWAQRRGYVRNTLNERKCDFWPGVASNVEMVATTRPYYRSTYMFVTRRDANIGGLTLNDPRLKELKIGVQLVGELAPMRVNAIHPGVVEDSPYWSGKNLDKFRSRTPTGRMTEMADVVDAVRFLLENKAVNGIDLRVDGGWMTT